MSLEIKKITPPVCYLYSPEREYLSVLNEYQFHDIRVQIKQKKLDGYYCLFRTSKGVHRLDIDSDGRSNDWNDDTFQQISNSLIELL
jgi:hypothetical protein